ncbi:uncharacterized protein KY384_004478 [Bacidia gigantensis]|uniref:uncharacterized protein n=1 Tax=Bacidia gigantensis TaxID=2732470 RepID=UPI001D04A14D|nr:uncharacterized protein KY384_004478 [Bacidia gigantensis]KAG8531121.1 hypothetical protein KY384_004478 [Bacidia gigantensis]
MASLSFVRLLTLSATLYHIVFAVPQAPLEAATQSSTFLPPAQQANAPVSGNGCNECQLVADVAGLVWYSQVFLNTAATNVVQVGVNNASRTTRTSIIQNEGEFTYAPGGDANGGQALTQLNYEPSVTVAGAVLTSPTAYNVFTGYTITSAFLSDGQCVTTSQSSSLASAYSEILSSANGRVILDVNGQSDFLSFLGFVTCSGGGENIQPTALLQVSNTTATSTTTFSGIMAAQSVSLSIASSTPASASASVTANVTFPSVGVPNIVIGNTTITPSANPIGLPVYNGTTFAGSGTGGLQPVPTGPVTPFVAAANTLGRADGWLVAWIVGSIGVGALVIYL